MILARQVLACMAARWGHPAALADQWSRSAAVKPLALITFSALPFATDDFIPDSDPANGRAGLGSVPSFGTTRLQRVDPRVP